MRISAVRMQTIEFSGPPAFKITWNIDLIFDQNSHLSAHSEHWRSENFYIFHRHCENQAFQSLSSEKSGPMGMDVVDPNLESHCVFITRTTASRDSNEDLPEKLNSFTRAYQPSERGSLFLYNGVGHIPVLLDNSYCTQSIICSTPCWDRAWFFHW